MVTAHMSDYLSGAGLMTTNSEARPRTAWVVNFSARPMLYDYTYQGI